MELTSHLSNSTNQIHPTDRIVETGGTHPHGHLFPETIIFKITLLGDFSEQRRGIIRPVHETQSSAPIADLHPSRTSQCGAFCVIACSGNIGHRGRSFALESSLDQPGKKISEGPYVLPHARIFQGGHVGIACLNRDHGPRIAARAQHHVH